MVYLRNLAFTLAIIVSPGIADLLKPLIKSSKVAARSGIEDVQLRAISRSSEKRDQLNNLTPRSTVLNLDYVDGQLISLPMNYFDLLGHLLIHYYRNFPRPRTAVCRHLILSAISACSTARAH